MNAQNDRMIEEVETRLDEIFRDVEESKEVEEPKALIETMESSQEISSGLPEKSDDQYGASQSGDLERNKKSPIPDSAGAQSMEGLLPVNPSSESSENSEESVLRDLKELVLSIEWEITDDLMSRFVEEVARLGRFFAGDRVLEVLFKMLESLGKYIRKYKANANPGALKVLNSVFSGSEQILSSGNLREEEKERILSAELRGFKKLQGEIRARKHYQKEKQPFEHLQEISGREREGDQSAIETLKSIEENFSKLMGELKVYVHLELDNLKTEMIRLLKERGDDGIANSPDPVGKNE